MFETASAMPERHFVVGGYPASPSWAGDHHGLVRFVDQLLTWQPPAGRSMGLEVPFTPTWVEPSVLASTPPASRHVLTMIPATMIALRSNDGYGLASENDDGRRAAIDDVRKAVEFAQAVNAGPGGKVIAIELQSAPRAPFASAEAFGRSFEDLAHVDLDGVALWVEHSDARVPGQAFEKGFLSLDDEIRLAGAHGLGVLVNWGRSAIELRSADRVTEHVQTAVDAGALQGLIFSGVASVATEYGPPWVDAHFPVKGSMDGGSRTEADASLLTPAHVEHSLRAADVPRLSCVGIKMGMPLGTPDDARMAMLQANVELVAALVDAEMQKVVNVPTER